MQRRDFLKTITLFGVTYFVHQQVGACMHLAQPQTDGRSPFSPVQGGFSGADFTGDDATHAHDALWDLENYIKARGGRPSTVQKNDIVVVGGGVSGLLSAYQLQDLHPLLIEQAPRLGGNSKAETFKGSSFALGAAYVVAPEKDSDMDKLLKDLNLQGRTESEDESRVHFQNKGLKKLWDGETDPTAKEEILRVDAEFKKISAGPLPEIPWADMNEPASAETKKLDAQTAEQWLNHKFPSLHPHIREYFQIYCWSSFGGSLEEISAAQFLNFVGADGAGILAFPGGNAALAEALYQKIKAKTEIQTGSMVLEIKADATGVNILFENAERKLVAVHARAAVVTVPKFVARYIIKDLPAKTNDLWKTLNYRAYVVVNVLLKNPVRSSSFDLFCLKGKVPPAPTFSRPSDRAWTDISFADWAGEDSGSRRVLTLYRPYAFDGARNTLMGPDAHEKIKKEILAELPSQFASLGLGENSIEAIRLTRWGHAIPLAQKGLIADESLEKIGAPLDNKIFFANQDNFMNPSFETCLSAAQIATAQLRRALKV